MRDENYYTNKGKNNTLLIVLIVIMAILLLGLGGYIIYDKVLNKPETPTIGEEEKDNALDESNKNLEDVKEISISSNLITNLVYPQNDVGLGKIYNSGAQYWDYKDITVDTLGRTVMMQNAARVIEPDKSTSQDADYYSATKVKASFQKIYGPDANYFDGKLDSNSTCKLLSEYDSSTKMYIAYTGCGADPAGTTVQNAKIYKAEQTDEYLYVYEYVQAYLVLPEDITEDNKTKAYLLNKNGEKTKEINYVNREKIVNEMIANGEASTYKWTFKKQSDGNYYFYSGKWQ